MKASIFKSAFDSRNKTIFLLSLFILCAVFSLTSALVWSSYSSATTQAERDSLNLARLIENETANTFEKIDLMLKNINRHFEFSSDYKKWDKDSYYKLIEKAAVEIPEVKAVKILDDKGFYVSESDNSGPLFAGNNSERKYFQQLKNNPMAGLFISEPVISRTAKIWVVVLARALYSPDDRFRGVLLATVPIDQFEKSFSKLNIGRNGNVSLISRQDHYLISRYPRAEGKIGSTIGLSESFIAAFRNSPANGNVFTISNVDKIEKVFGYSANTQFNFIVTVGLAKTDYLAHWYWQIAILSLSFLIGSLIVVYFLKNYLESQQSMDEQKIKLIESAKLASLGEMAAGVAHEINSPLAIIQGQSDLIRFFLEQDANSTDKIVIGLDRIDKTIGRIAKIIKGLKSFSRQSEDDPMSNCSLETIITGSLALCAEKFKQNCVDLKVDPVPDLSITCRESQISQVLINLLSNAFDACSVMPEKWIHISFKQDINQILILVTDSGQGIPQQIHNKIMNPFYTTKPTGKGTGLGLSISKGIVEAHNGHLYLNAKNENTQFVCELPIVVKKDG